MTSPAPEPAPAHDEGAAADDDDDDDDAAGAERSRAARAPRVIPIGGADAGRTIEKVLMQRLPAPWARVGKLLRQGRVQAGERTLARGDVVAPGQEVVVSPPSEAPRPPQPNRRLRLRVVHEDPDLVVIAKAPGVPMHPGPGHGTDTVLNALVGRYPELLELGHARGWGLVHRLDRDTSGLLVVARTVRAYEALVAAFAGRRVSKQYLALVAGAPPAASGEVSAPVDAKEALTRYEVVERARGASLVRAWPVTGRMHQVRVHLAHLGCPVLGDAKHGDASGAATSVRPPRLALHAHRLELEHPVSGEALAFEEALPRDLRRAWERGKRPRAGPAAGDEPPGERRERPRGSRGAGSPRGRDDRPPARRRGRG